MTKATRIKADSIMLMLLFFFTLSLGKNVNQGNEKVLQHPCDRQCDNTPQTCQYVFTVEWHTTLSEACLDCPVNQEHCSRPDCIAADGFKRSVLVANKMLPGPEIKVCLHDLINIRVENGLSNGENTTIHWHGLDQSSFPGTPFMDGADMITQYPIPSSEDFRYSFLADKAGTHLWHSHTGVQRHDGLQGPFIVRSQTDPHHSLYDHDCDTPSGECELVIFLSDWDNEDTAPRIIRKPEDAYTRLSFLSTLMNGKNRKHEINGTTTPWEEFSVAPNKRYRLRFISGASDHCQFKVAVDRHNLTLIATDGQPVQPVEVDTFVITNGERFDFIINFDQPADNYWMQAWGTLQCDGSNAYGIIRYQGAPAGQPGFDRDLDRAGRLVNPILNTGRYNTTYGESDILMYQLNNTADSVDSLAKRPVDQRIVVGMDFNRYTDEIDGSTFLLPHVNNVLVGEVVELVMVNEAITVAVGHPFHLHGHKFAIMSTGTVGDSTNVEEVLEKWQSGALPINENPSYGDTLWIPQGGYGIVRFLADNPGMWFLHCHIDLHLESGMAMVIQVGEYSDFPAIPPFIPYCRNQPPPDQQNIYPSN